MKTNRSPHSSIKIGILGLGTVGSAVAKVITKRPELGIKVKMGCDLRRVNVPCPLTHDPWRLINDPEIQIIVETMGGVNPAKQYVLAALKAGKHVVTSNKELIARHMAELMAAAKRHGVFVLFEGAVGGGIPILNTLRDNLFVNRIDEVYGIVNGTTNYILSKMTAEGKEFDAVLKEAQKLGYAEANPKADIEGYDASYKAAILASVAFGANVKWADVYREGIEKIVAEDIAYASEIGYVIKLLAIVKRGNGKIDVRVHPALVSKSHPLANVTANFNAIYVKGSPVGELMFYGQGAGGGPTSSAVVSDVASIAGLISCCEETCQCSGNVRSLPSVKVSPITEIENRYYIRMEAADRHGVLAGIAKAFADKKVSNAAVNQKETRGSTATIVILVHKVAEKNLVAALRAVKRLSVVRKISNVLRIL
ncbi:MAG: homoserine dehydrogenase [Candidatus Margulisbacteria bacterium]|nr:homoserine dehydrogenase [Candidatus Margulisiibacteriota bacterium]